MQRRQRGGVRRRCCNSCAWPRLPALCVLALCWLQLGVAQTVVNPFNVTNYGPIGANGGALLPRLSTYIPTGTYIMNNTISLGTTTYRWALLCHTLCGLNSPTQRAVCRLGQPLLHRIGCCFGDMCPGDHSINRSLCRAS